MTVAAPAVTASTFAIRRAEPGDDAARRALMSDVAMDAELALSVRRHPTMAATYALHARDWDEWVIEQDGRSAGMGAVLARDGWLGGERVPVGYLGDLRFAPGARGRNLLDRFYPGVLEEARRRWGCEHFLSAIIASNERARRALVTRTARAERSGRPRYTLLREFDIRSVQLVLPLLPERSPWRIRAASDGDVPAIAALLDRDGRSRPFGYAFDETELRRRLATWPGLRTDSFLLAESARGEIVGALALWDAAPVKETVVLGYRGSMRRVRVIHDALATLLRRPRLPAPGAPFRYQYATHVAVPAGDPTVLRALLRGAHVRARSEGYHFVSICAPAGDPATDTACRGMLVIDLRAHLYAVALPGVRLPPVDATAPFPGFEMALA